MRRIDGLMRADSVTRVEQPWMDALDQLGFEGLRDELVGRGVPAATAAGIVFWLADQRERRRFTSRPTATRYREVLRDLGRCTIGGQFKQPLRAA